MNPSARVLLLVAVAGVALVATRVLSRLAPKLLGYRSGAAVAAVVGASGVVAAALAPGAPTDLTVVDAVYRFAFGALVPLFASRARRVAWLAAGALAALGAHPDAWGFAGFALLGIATGTTLGRRWARPMAALWGAVLAQVLLHLTWPEPIGLTAMLAAGASTTLGVSWYHRAPTLGRQRAQWGAGSVAALTVALVLLAAVAGLTARSGLTSGVDEAERGLVAARAGDLDAATQRFQRAATVLDGAHRDLSAWWARPVRSLPVLGRYLADAESLTGVGAGVAHRAGRVAERGSAQLEIVDGGIDLAGLEELRAELATSTAALQQAEQAMRSPSAADWTPGPLRDRYDRLAGRLRDGAQDAQVLGQAVELAPGLLGGEDPRRWLLAVFTPVEQRAGGGHIGNYGELVTEDGRARLDHFGRASDVYRLQPDREVTLDPDLEEAFARYGDVGVTNFFQNAMQVPDFSLSASAMEQLYPQLDGNEVSGTIAIDPTGVAALLKVTGPVRVASWPEPITAENAERLLYFQQYVEYGADVDERIDFMGDVARAVVRELTRGDLGSPSVLISALAPAIDAGHVQVHSAVPEEQAYLESVGAAGTMPPPDGGDFVRVGTQNASESKLEWFLHRRVRYDPVFDPDTGTVSARLEVELRNAAPPDGLPAYVLGGSPVGVDFPPPGHSRLVVTVYSPLDLEGAELDGASLEMTDERHLGYNAYAAVVVIPPESSIRLELDLEGTIHRNRIYRLRVGAQPQVHPDALTVSPRAAEGWLLDRADHRTDAQIGELSMAVELHRR